MPKQQGRGTKRKCQNADCALPFYDLNRSDYTCPNCGAAFDTTVMERVAATLHYGSRRVQAPIIAAPRRALEEPAQSEEIEAAEATADPADEIEGDLGSNPILEPDEEEDDGIVVNPPAGNRVED